jgi:hypothetical protein
MTCLLLHIKNPSVDKFLRNQQILPLPSPVCIRSYLRKVNVKCGLDEKFFEAFRLKLRDKTEFQKHGILLFDEMSVRTSLQVNVKNMKFEGVTDFGDEEPPPESLEQLADHGLVFMFSPLGDNYSQPVAVYASKGPTKGDMLAKLILKIICKLEDVGAYVDGIICDGATTNRKMWKIFGVSGELNKLNNKFVHPLDESRYVWVFSDTPHLIKCVRNRIYNNKILQVHSPASPTLALAAEIYRTTPVSASISL